MAIAGHSRFERVGLAAKVAFALVVDLTLVITIASLEEPTKAVNPVLDWIALLSVISMYGEPQMIPSIRSLAARLAESPRELDHIRTKSDQVFLLCAASLWLDG
jgi:hypothetical protein